MKTVTIAGGDLFRLAMEELGDATQWVRIARLNGLEDPMLTGLNTVLIPPRGFAATGGIGGDGIAGCIQQLHCDRRADDRARLHTRGLLGECYLGRRRGSD